MGGISRAALGFRVRDPDPHFRNRTATSDLHINRNLRPIQNHSTQGALGYTGEQRGHWDRKTMDRLAYGVLVTNVRCGCTKVTHIIFERHLSS